MEPGLYPREFHDLQMIRRYRDFFLIVLKEEIIVFRVFFFYNLFSFLSVQVDRIYSIDIYKFVLEISQRMWCLYILVYCNQTFSIPSFVYKISTSLFSIIILCNLMPSVNNLSKSLFFFLKTLCVFVLMRSYNAIILFKLIPIFKDFNSFWCLQRNMKWK